VSRFIRPLLVSALLSLLLAAPASAAPPEGECPPAFAPATADQLLDAYPQLIDAFGAQAIHDLVDVVDANDNGTVCWRPHPTNSRTFTSRTVVANLVDDTARSPHQ
jgi:hypothetical protein